MHFVVRKTKPGFFEDEYEVTLTEKVKNRARVALLFASIAGPTAYFLFADRSPSDKTEPSETPTSD